MSVVLLEQAAVALGELLDEVVFLGAATLPLWITDPAGIPLRPTRDVDVVVEVTSLIEYNQFEQRLRDRGFRDEGTGLGRFLLPVNNLQLDAIPADASILGFKNHWQRASLPVATSTELPSGSKIRVLPPPNLLATKLEAFAGRGEGDYLASPDFEDVVALIDGRKELVDEIGAAAQDLQKYVIAQLSTHRRDPRAREAMVANLEPGGDGQARADATLFPRLDRILGRSSGS